MYESLMGFDGIKCSHYEISTEHYLEQKIYIKL